MTTTRPIGVTLIAFLAILAAVWSFVITLQMLHIIPVFLGPVEFYTFSLIGAIMYGLLGFIYLWLFRMLWDLQPQGWMFAVLLSVFNLIFDLISIIGATHWKALLPGIFLSAVILIYCMSPGTKQAFGIPQ
jgi:hypothetical protein